MDILQPIRIPYSPAFTTATAMAAVVSVESKKLLIRLVLRSGRTFERSQDRLELPSGERVGRRPKHEIDIRAVCANGHAAGSPCGLSERKAFTLAVSAQNASVRLSGAHGGDFNHFPEDPEFADIIQRAEQAIEGGVCPERISQGSSGSYFVKDSKGVRTEKQRAHGPKTFDVENRNSQSGPKRKQISFLKL